MKLGWLATTPQPSHRPELGCPWRKFPLFNAFYSKTYANRISAVTSQSARKDCSETNQVMLENCDHGAQEILEMMIPTILSERFNYEVCVKQPQLT